MTGSKVAPSLTLGSASPRRRELLAQIGITPHSIVPAEIDEEPLRGELPRDYVRRMAREKALALSATVPGAVLSADPPVVAGRRILGKPADADEAGEFLRLLSGRRHLVLTAVALSHAGRLRERLVETTIRFRPLTAAEIDDYLASSEWHGKAGGYAVQGRAGSFVAWMRGSYSGVVGLPLAETATLLAGIGIRGGWE
ncbi:MAG TPA: nucleoside triphosphate pyrophosphatase [Paracoccus sp. (in: a-proteobacteria)]|nr:nucleoside triphosphate pyrophosphatase [Paracoccus sp. (in: a-proteobacteria)]